ncbi:MAG: (Fe-S)-binding protein, partial [Thermoanaerobaculia bacterium]
AAPYHRDDIVLTERLKLAAPFGWEAKLFASMAQTDCGACGWDCEGYAHALATGETKDVSLCVPGDTETLDSLKKLMKEAGKEFSAS